MEGMAKKWWDGFKRGYKKFSSVPRGCIGQEEEGKPNNNQLT